MICSRLNLFLAMGPPLAINYTKTLLPYGPILRGQVKGFTSLGCDPRCDFAQADIEQREVGTQEVGPNRINVVMRRLKSLKSSSYQWVLFHLILPYSF